MRSEATKTCSTARWSKHITAYHISLTIPNLKCIRLVHHIRHIPWRLLFFSRSPGTIGDTSMVSPFLEHLNPLFISYSQVNMVKSPFYIVSFPIFGAPQQGFTRFPRAILLEEHPHIALAAVVRARRGRWAAVQGTWKACAKAIVLLEGVPGEKRLVEIPKCDVNVGFMMILVTVDISTRTPNFKRYWKCINQFSEQLWATTLEGRKNKFSGGSCWI